MARTITVRIIDETAANAIPTPAGGSGIAAEPNPSGSTPSGKKKNANEKTMTEILWILAGKRIVNYVKSESMYYTGKYFNLTENYYGQTFVANATQTIEDNMAVATSAMMGLKMGGTVGAVVATVMSVAQKTLKALDNYAEEARKMAENAYGNYFYGERAGFVAGGHGTEN